MQNASVGDRIFLGFVLLIGGIVTAIGGAVLPGGIDLKFTTASSYSNIVLVALGVVLFFVGLKLAVTAAVEAVATRLSAKKEKMLEAGIGEQLDRIADILRQLEGDLTDYELVAKTEFARCISGVVGPQFTVAADDVATVRVGNTDWWRCMCIADEVLFRGLVWANGKSVLIIPLGVESAVS